jgi:acyl dehydratase
MVEGYRFETIPQFVGKDLGSSPWVVIDQARINAFADATFDHQWIHVDVERAKKESPFGAPIAHGFLTLSLLSKFLGEVGVLPSDASRAVNAGLSNVRFKAAVPVDSRVRGTIKLADAQAKGEGRILITAAIVVEVEGQKDPALTADMVIMLFR